jgi:RimJ/RimL family protein N-acetyltransferase
MAAPERIVLDGGLVLRRWRSADARALTLAVAESFEHLRPWMPWVTAPRLEEERAVLVKWEEEWDAGGELQYGLFLGPLAVGSIGLIPRIGPGGLEIGYWVHAGHTRRGYATSAAAALTSMAFTLPGIEVVEIHHDRANLASEGVPRKLGFTLVGEHPRPSRLPTSPAESGTYRIWRMTRDRWRPSGASLPPPSP